MAFPVIQGTLANSTTATAATSHTITLPSGITAGERIQLIVGVENITADPTITGYTGVQIDTGTSGPRLYGFRKTAVGGESGTVTMATNASTEMVASAFRVTGADLSLPIAGADNGGLNSTTNDPPALNIAAAPYSWTTTDNLWFAIVLMSNGNVTISSYPTGYTALTPASTGVTSGGASGFTLGIARITTNTTNTTVDPPAYTTSAGAGGSISVTAALAPTAGATPVNTNLAAATVLATGSAAAVTNPPPPVNTNLAAATVLATGQAGSVQNPVPAINTNLAVATATAQAQTATFTPGARSIALAQASLTATALAISATAGAPPPVNTGLGSAVLLAPAANATLQTPRSIDLAPASIAVQGQNATPPDTTDPSIPQNLVANDGLDPTLTWDASTDNVGVHHYDIYRGTASGPGKVKIDESLTTSYADASAASGTTYWYTVRAVDATGNDSAASNEASATALAPPNTTLATATIKSTGQSGTVSNPPAPTAVLTFPMSGALTDTSFKARAKVTTGASGGIKLAAYSNSGRTTKVAESTTLTPNASNYVIGEVTGLSADTEYWYGWLDGTTLRPTGQGVARTFPAAGTASSFTFWAASCWSVTDSSAFATINANNPDFGIHLGDFDYENINTTTVANHVSAREIGLANANQAALYRDHPLIRTWSDHDFCGNASDGTSTGKAAAQEAWRRMEADYTLPATVGNVGAIYKSFQVGRFHFFMMDTRSEADPIAANPTSTTRGRISSTQETAFLDWLDAHPSDPKVVISAEPWHSPQSNTEDDWGNFVGQRSRIATHISTNGITNIAFLSGDMHACAWQDSGIPGGSGVKAAIQSAPLGRPGASHKGGPWDLAQPADSSTDPRAYGFFTVTDTGGSTATMRFSARNGVTDAELWNSDLSVVNFTGIGTAGPINVDLQPATVNATANNATFTPGARSITLAQAATTLTAPTAALTANRSIDLAAASTRLTASSATFTPGARSITLSQAAASLTAPTSVLTTPRSISLASATTALTGNVLAITANRSVDLASAGLVIQAQAIQATAGAPPALNTPLAAATVAAQAANMQLTANANVVLNPAALTASAANMQLTANPHVSVSLALAALTASAATLQPTGNYNLVLSPATLTASAANVLLVQDHLIQLAPATLNATANNSPFVPGTRTITLANAALLAQAYNRQLLQTTQIELDPATLTMAAQTTQLIRGPTPIVLQPAVLTTEAIRLIMVVTAPPPERQHVVLADVRAATVQLESRQKVVSLDTRRSDA